MPSNPDCSFDQLDEGMSAERDYVIDPALYESFLNLFGDNSLVHTSEAFAARNGFREIVTHGAILNGFLSNFVGTCLPGRRSLELSVDIRYLNPCHVGDRVRVRGEVSQKLESRRALVLMVTWHNLTRDSLAARARVHVSLLEH